jgi:hypothetical protein
MRYYLKHSRVPLIYAVAIPLALILGCLVSSPDPFTFAMLGMILLFLILPLFIKWHHAMLIIFWNSAFNVFFLPGQPDLWLLVATVSFGISLLNYVMFQKEFLRVPEMTRPLLLLAAVVLATAWYRGGIGLRAFGGGSMGGKYYIYILGAIIGYFAFTAGQVPILKSGKMTGLFFLSGATFALSNLAYTLGPVFYFLYYLVPSDLATGQAASDAGLVNIDRITSLEPACLAVFCFLLARYSLRGIFEWSKPWRLAFLCLTVGGAFFAGFRSGLILLILIFAFQFYFEGLLRTRFLPVMIGLAAFSFVLIMVFSDRLPPVAQRAISFLPVNVDAEIRADAKGSTDWRLQMWSIVLKDVPKYLIIGKGYGIDPTDMFLTTEAIRMGMLPNYEESLLAGDYHSGPLSVLIPFGLPGMLAFLWVLIAGFRILYGNYRYGDARLRRVNTTLLAYYLTYCFAFFFIFGGFSTQLIVFLGVVGLSVSLNGGVKKTSATNGRLVAVPETLAVGAG